jgi:hypothetical protein
VCDVHAMIMSAATFGHGSRLSCVEGLRESYYRRGTRPFENEYRFVSVGEHVGQL